MENERGGPIVDDARYRAIFEHAAVALLELDISRLRERLQEMRRAGLAPRFYLLEHPEFPQQAAGLVDVTDVNRATRALLGVDQAAPWGPIKALLHENARAAMSETILAIDEGRTDIEAEFTAASLRGGDLRLIARLHVPPAGAAYTRLLVSLIDITARKQAEERERMAANILHSIIESIPDPVFVKDRALRMVLCNAAHSRSVGKEPSATYGKTDIENGWDEELIKGNPSKGIRGWEKDDLAALEGRTVQTSAVPSDVRGTVRYFDAVKLPLRDRAGTIIGVIGIGRDVTERSRLESELAWERSLFAALMDNMPDQIYFKDRDSRYLRNSRSHAHALGLSDPSEALGKSDSDFFSPESAGLFRENEREIMRTGAPEVDVEERQAYVDRPDTWVSTTKMALRDERGEIRGTFGISHDITRRKTLLDRNQQLATLVESSDDAIVGIGMDRRITVWNRGAERIYGYTAEEMIGAPTTLLIPPELEDEARLMREKLARGEQIEHFETTRLRKDGSRIIVSLTLSAIRDASGKVVSMASVARDVTAQKAIQAQLSRVQRLESLATLAGGVAHRFNNINTVVKGYLGLLRGERDLSDRLRRFVAAADDAVNRAVDITDRLLMMTDPSPEGSAAVRLDALARSTLARFGELLSSERVTLVQELAETPPACGEESRLRFVVSSLLTNALDALLDRPARVLTVRTGRLGGQVFLDVEDTGCGIPATNLPKIFSPFFSTKGEWAPSGSPQARLKGLGLSLSISSSTVSDYGGRIEVRSTEGEGSVFRVLLPAENGPGVP